jgi:TolA-binding protein
LGTLYVGQNRVNDAIHSFERFLSLAPDHAKAPLAKQLLDYLKK